MGKLKSKPLFTANRKPHWTQCRGLHIVGSPTPMYIYIFINTCSIKEHGTGSRKILRAMLGSLVKQPVIEMSTQDQNNDNIDRFSIEDRGNLPGSLPLLDKEQATGDC